MYKNNSLAAKRHGNCRFLCNFVGMKETLEDYIRLDANFRQALLNLEGGIMNYWAQHPDAEFDRDLFNSYENQIVEDYLQANKRNRVLVSLSECDLKVKARDWYHLTEKEIHYKLALQPILATMTPVKVRDDANRCIDDYLVDAYRDYRQCIYPEGIPPRNLYNGVIDAYRMDRSGLAFSCLWMLFRERVQGVTEKSERDMLDEFLALRYSYAIWEDGGFKKLRQAVKEMLDGKSPEMCRRLAIDMMKKVGFFSRVINNNNAKICLYDKIVTADDREWLRSIASKGDMFDLFGKPQISSLHLSYARFVSLLADIGRIWAAQLLVNGIDMHDLEKETRATLYRVSVPNGEIDYNYYIDKDTDDLPGECCVFDEDEAEMLLSKIKPVDSIEEETQKEEKKKDIDSHKKQIDTTDHQNSLPLSCNDGVFSQMSQPENKQLRPKGRKPKKFEDFIYEDAPKELMPVLEEMMNEASGRKALTIILSITGVYIDKPTNKSVCDRFNTVGETAYGTAIARHEGATYGEKDFSKKPDPIPETEITRMREKISERIKELQNKAQ